MFISVLYAVNLLSQSLLYLLRFSSNLFLNLLNCSNNVLRLLIFCTNCNKSTSELILNNFFILHETSFQFLLLPNFVNLFEHNFNIDSISPARYSGNSSALNEFILMSDKNGVLRASPPDIGAYQYN